MLKKNEEVRGINEHPNQEERRFYASNERVCKSSIIMEQSCCPVGTTKKHSLSYCTMTMLMSSGACNELQGYKLQHGMLELCLFQLERI